MGDDSLSKTTWLVAAAACVAAVIPHFFFTTPLELHMRGDMKAWLAIAVWAPAMLAGAGFFDSGEFSDAFERPELERWRTIALVLAPFGFLFATGFQYLEAWTGMPRIPWDELSQAVPLYAAAWALTVVFWQGLVQFRLFAQKSSIVRVAIVVAGNVAIVAPFIIHTGIVPALRGYLSSTALAALILGILFEMGASVRSLMIVAGLMGAMFVWFQQAALL